MHVFATAISFLILAEADILLLYAVNINSYKNIMPQTYMSARRKQNYGQDMPGMDAGINPLVYQQMCAGYGATPFAQQQLGMMPIPYQQMCMNNGMTPVVSCPPQVSACNGMVPSPPSHSLDMSNMPPRFTRNTAKGKLFPAQPPPLPESDEAPDYVREAVQKISPVLAKQWIGELLYVRVKKEISKHVGKITGMLLEMDNETLLSLIDDRKELRMNIAQAWKVLCGDSRNKLMEKMSNWVA